MRGERKRGILHDGRRWPLKDGGLRPSLSERRSSPWRRPVIWYPKDEAPWKFAWRCLHLRWLVPKPSSSLKTKAVRTSKGPTARMGTHFPPKRGQLLGKLISRKLAEENRRKRNDPTAKSNNIPIVYFISHGINDRKKIPERRTFALAPCYEPAESGAAVG